VPDFGDQRVMGCSRADLERWVAELLGPGVGRFVGDRLDLAAAGVPIAIVVRDLPPRTLGLIRFHELEVRFEYPPEQRAIAREWIARFDRHTQRGGG